jgi:hypothetical protein
MLREMRREPSSEVEQLSHELNVVIPQAIAHAVELGDLRKTPSTRPPWSASSSSRPGWGSCTSD